MGSRALAAPPAAPGPPGLFMYPMDPPPFTNSAIGASETFDLLTDTDYDFLWDRVIAFPYRNIVPPSPYSVYLQDASNGLFLMGSPQNPVFAENLAGIGLRPAWLPKKVRIPKGTVLSGVFTMRQAIAVGSYQIQFCLVGKKVIDA